MPLRDHFRPPLSDDTPWSVFHGNWAVKMVDRLNGGRLSEKYKAQAGRHFGAQLEIDVATLEPSATRSLFEESNGHDGGVATTTEVYSPPTAALSATVRFDDPNLFEVKVYRGSGGWNLVAAVELVSEANRDREEHRRTFAVKCGSYLQKGISLVVIDTVTTYSAELHDELCDLIDGADALRWSSPSGLSVVAYRATRTTSESGPVLGLDVYPFPVGIGQELPTVPLWLGPETAVPLELELTYSQASRSLRLE